MKKYLFLFVCMALFSACHNNTSSNALDILFLDDMVFVEGGSFSMGCSGEHWINGGYCDDNACPAHTVEVDDFYISKHEITVLQWYKVIGKIPPYVRGLKNDFWNCPVVKVSYHDCLDFIEKLNKKTGKEYRLPTEAEWEFAARGGKYSKGYVYSGSNRLDSVGWYENNTVGYGKKVGLLKPNELGIYDMSGGVAEWCLDNYDDYYYRFSPVDNPICKQGINDLMVVRGGSWSGDSILFCTVFGRQSRPAQVRDFDLGFRLVLCGSRSRRPHIGVRQECRTS
jgi:formylglycine-generating enzyme required for sulfatase activity